ncbi:MAG: histidine kinase [Bacteroidales bacterium]|nr:histidine kinase [Bacteroidales bacterium]
MKSKTILKHLPFREILLHLAFWVVVWFFFVYFFSYNTEGRVYILWFSSALLPVTMFVTYLMVYRLIPKFLLDKRYGLFALYSFYTLVFSAYVVVLIIYACLFFILDSEVSSMPPMAKNFVSVMILIYLVVGIVSLINLLNYNFKTISRNKELQNKILTTQLQLKEQELSYLKMQIHPHFLFNTLNTIYGFAIKQSRQTPDIILKLSNLLDYILYQVSKPRVSLSDEVAHIREYIELERIRFEETLKVSFKAGTIDKKIQIAPMLLIPFVENAFKHGNLVDGFLSIDIEIAVTGKRLDFSISNTILADEANPEKRGIGLENIRKRLELHYGDDYRLRAETRDKQYSVYLIIFNLNTQKDAPNDTMPDS